MEELSFRNEKGQKIAGMLHKPKGKGPWPLIVISHWFKGDMDDFDDLADHLAKKFIVYRFDYNDFGDRTDIPLKTLTISRELETLAFVLSKLRQNPNVIKDKIGLLDLALEECFHICTLLKMQM